MARHIMAVCVVCLLCADHLPCKQHDDSDLGLRLPPMSIPDNHRRLEPLGSAENGHHHLVKRHTHGHDHHHHHGDHDHDDHDEDEDVQVAVREKLDVFMAAIFKEFGDPTSMTMGVVGFENMMKRLNMYRLVTDQLPGSSSPVTASNHDHDSDSDEAVRLDLGFA